MKKRMLYMSHVDWKWIKQRPHFLAESLAEHFDIMVLYAFQNRNRGALQKREDDMDVYPVYSLPFAGRVKALGMVSTKLMKLQYVSYLKRHKPDYVFLTYPNQVDLLPEEYRGKVIYDCMDNHVEMMQSITRKKLLFEQERRLLKRADVIFVSSLRLMDVLAEKYGKKYREKMVLIRNGYRGTGGQQCIAELPHRDDGFFELSYFGTVSHWFNFDYILRSLRDFPNLKYRIIGPSDANLPQTDRLEYVGTVEHHKLFDTVKHTDCLIMPFQLNDIILAVDPVKLYEYINFNKNILTVRYNEIERFGPFVHFYEDYDSFCAQIRSMIGDNTIKYSAQQRHQFLEQNSWSARVEAIMEALDRL